MGLLQHLLPGALPALRRGPPGALRAGTRVGPWRVVRLLGHGGGGAVYLVSRWGRLYALKLALRPGDKRLLREGRLLRRINHPGVVKLRGRGWWLGRKQGFPYLVMEYVEGLPLYAWARGTNPTARQLAELMAQAASALEAVHGEHSVHRDLKGANTLVRPGGRELVLIDLGAGDFEGATPLTSNVLPPGTEVYLSPEAMAFARVHASDKQARYKAQPSQDLYALGVMTHRALTDDYPFPVHLPRDIFWLLAETQPAPNAHEENPRVPVALASIVQQLLAKRPEDRHASAREVAEALRKAAKEGGPEWDAPLFEWYSGPSPASHTTQPGAPVGPVAPGQEAALRLAHADHHEWQEWMRERRQVRRRPPAVAHGEEAAPAPSSPKRWRNAWGALTLILTLTLGVSHDTPTLEVGNPDQEVAGALRPPDADARAEPSRVSTPAPVAPAMQPKEDSPVKTPAQPVDPSGQKQPLPRSKPSPASGRKLAKVLPLCVGLSCSSAPVVRPTPPPEECPPGALQAMRELGINTGDMDPRATFLPHAHQQRNITMKEGQVTMTFTSDVGGLPAWTQLSGRLVFGDRVYGRFTMARPYDLQTSLPGQQTLPVCFDLYEVDERKPGIPRQPESTEDNVIIRSLVGARAVDRFE